MTNITKHQLDFEKTKTYFIDSIKNCNMLGDKLLELTQLNLGTFFSLLPKDFSSCEAHEFKGLSIKYLPQSHLFKFILKKMHSNKNYICVFDDFNSNYESAKDDPFFHQYGKRFGEEIYSVLRNKDVTLKAIETAYHYSDTIWHSLGILSEAKVNSDPKLELSNQEIEEICRNAKYIFVTAYDGEGCIFWEKN